jgi:nicotinamide riboside transporter PnuC
MGWRAWDAYEWDAEERQRVLPWHERYNWRGLIVFALIVALAGTFLRAELQ